MISVLITTYNYGQFIEQAIDSVLSQDLAPEELEVLIVDDGSTDDTAERVKRYGTRVNYFYKPNGGQASALNFGFQRARGQIVALLDADDMFLPSKLARVREAFHRDQAVGMVYHAYEQWIVSTNQRLDSNHPLFSGNALADPDHFFSYFPHPTSCISFRRSYLSRVLPIPEHLRMAADAYPVNLVPFVAPIVALPDRLVVYRIHGRNSWPSFENVYQADENRMPPETRHKKLEMWRLVTDAMRKWLAENGLTRQQKSVRTFLDRWALYEQGEEFKLEAPGRLRFFMHLMLYNQCYGPHNSARLRLTNYANAAGALFTGYKHFHVLEDLRKKAMSSMRRLSKPEPGRQ